MRKGITLLEQSFVAAKMSKSLTCATMGGMRVEWCNPSSSWLPLYSAWCSECECHSGETCPSCSEGAALSFVLPPSLLWCNMKSPSQSLSSSFHWNAPLSALHHLATLCMSPPVAFCDCYSHIGIAKASHELGLSLSGGLTTVFFSNPRHCVDSKSHKFLEKYHPWTPSPLMSW